jgi:hypothetical protein
MVHIALDRLHHLSNAKMARKELGDGEVIPTTPPELEEEENKIF